MAAHSLHNGLKQDPLTLPLTTSDAITYSDQLIKPKLGLFSPKHGSVQTGVEEFCEHPTHLFPAP